MTEYYNFKQKTNEKELKHCADIIKNGGTVVFPTETVYGIGANALNKKAVEKIYKAKIRAGDNPLIVHISDKSMLQDLVAEINEIEQKLINAFMPGPFTIILKKKDIIPDVVSANLDTVGVRMPINSIAKLLIEEAGVPIAAPSANISGKPSGTNIEDIRLELKDRVDAIIDGGDSEIGLESTVVKVIDNIPVILRPGKITSEDIKKVIGIVKTSDKLFGKVKTEEKVESPGMKHKHYAPSTKCILVYDQDADEQIDKINQLIKSNENSYVLGFSEHRFLIETDNFINLGSMDNLEEISKNLFTVLREGDKKNADLLIIEGVEKTGLGTAIMNRLIRACDYNMI